MCSPSSYVGWTDFDACVYQARISGAGLFQWTPARTGGGCKLCPDGLDGEMKSTKASFARVRGATLPATPAAAAGRAAANAAAVAAVTAAVAGAPPPPSPLPEPPPPPCPPPTPAGS